MKKSLIAVALAFTSLPLAAHAQPNDWLQTVMRLEVPYGDLNLANPAGAETTMLRRIKFAASRVCGGAPDLRDLRARADFRACMHDAVDDAVAQLDAPLVTALHTGQPASDPRFASGYTRR